MTERFAGVGVSMYVGNGRGKPTEPEFWLEGASKSVAKNMKAQGLPYYFVDYGNGSNWRTGCDGGHNKHGLPRGEPSGSGLPVGEGLRHVILCRPSR
ncbi:hypothetical protein [Streptomyces sp. UNOB3_S3]|uniref:hypothetical protein n=1 Tax=Streptomyces sp. UNOB3_S3 TaxID=2871682 RepID=UPI001E3D8130|nr:hypothetical protein [Streptomyces sp. UNOB3_S3]MCC3779353.1 hypothetical protein [Streptomyces sp. UNOB3_S3]